MARSTVVLLVAFFALGGSGNAATPVDLLPGRATPLYGHLVAGDWNADGRADIASLSGNLPGNLDVVLGTGGGRFGRVVNSKVKGWLGVTGDFDGDGRMDILLSDPETTYNPERSSSTTFTLAHSRGDGHFDAGTAVVLDGYLATLAAGDYDGDHQLDAAVVGGSGKLLVLRGDGQGGLAAPVEYETGGKAGSLAAADLNRDGLTDIALSMLSGSGPAGRANVLLATTGGFAAPQSYAMPGCRSLLTGDLNGDGRPDLVCGAHARLATASGFGPLVALPGDGKVAIGDVTGDGRADLLTGGYVTFGVAAALAGGGFRPFHPYWALPPNVGIGEGGFSVGPLAVADFDGNGLGDVLASTDDSGMLFLARHLKTGRCANPVRGGFSQIDGTLFGDLMRAYTLHTYMRGRAGDDCLYASARSSQLYGDAGNDELRGGAAIDTLSGGSGADRIYAAGGKRDHVDCGPGRDSATIDRSDQVRRCERLVYR